MSNNRGQTTVLMLGLVPGRVLTDGLSGMGRKQLDLNGCFWPVIACRDRQFWVDSSPSRSGAGAADGRPRQAPVEATTQSIRERR